MQFILQTFLILPISDYRLNDLRLRTVVQINHLLILVIYSHKGDNIEYKMK